MAENQNEVLIGARGWLHPGWQNSFYPDGLPPDWQLAYYANEFSMVVIREQEWAQIEDLSALQEDCPPDFHFVVELPVLGDMDMLSSHIDRILQLGSQCAGLIVPPEQAQMPARCRAQLAETIPFYIEDETNSLIKVQAGTSLKQLRVLMETALQASTRSPVLFVVEGEPPDVELLRSAKIMLELL